MKILLSNRKNFLVYYLLMENCNAHDFSITDISQTVLLIAHPTILIFSQSSLSELMAAPFFWLIVQTPNFGDSGPVENFVGFAFIFSDCDHCSPFAMVPPGFHGCNGFLVDLPAPTLNFL